MHLMNSLRQGKEPASNRGQDLFFATISSVPEAAKELAVEAWEHPLDTAVHAAKTLGTSIAVGTAFGALIPSRGPAELMTAALFAMPILWGEYRKVNHAYHEAYRTGADIGLIGKQLAKEAICDATDIGLGFAGAGIGGRLGGRLAISDTLVGDKLQLWQRQVLKAENGGLLALDSVPNVLNKRTTAAAETTLSSRKTWFAPNNELLGQRIAQAEARTAAIGSPAVKEYYGNVHGHSRYSDGMGEPKEIYQSAKDGGQAFYAITDHNHLAARDGVKPGDPRAKDQAGTPIIAANPIEYTKTFQDAASISQEGKFVGLVGLEMGTIGKVGGGKSMQGGARLLDTGCDHGHAHADHHQHGGIDPTLPSAIRVHQPDGTVTTHIIPGETKGSSKQVAGREHRVADGGEHRVADGGEHRVAGGGENRVAGGGEHRVAGGGENRVAGGGENRVAVLEKPVAIGEKQNALMAEVAERPVKIMFPTSSRAEALTAAATRDASHYGGVNHINLFEVPDFYEAVRQPRGSGGKRFVGKVEPEGAELKAPTVVKYNDGDYKTMVDHLDQITDTTGKRPVIQLNHPRFVADWDPNLPSAVRGRDYGIKSFKNIDEWRSRFGKYASQIEVITGEALNPNTTTSMNTRDLGPINMAGYIDKGLHLSPTFGRDDHFALPNARPAGTGILAETLTKESVMDAMRERRTLATTSTEHLRGHMTVNDKHLMGTIFDQAAVNDLNIKMHIGGNLDPKAQYKVTLYSDKVIGDGKLAEPTQVKEFNGQDLLDTDGQVSFDRIRHKIGNSSAHYVEVRRTDPKSGNVDYLWTAPVWVEPLAGKHSLLASGLVGTGAQFIAGLQ